MSDTPQSFSRKSALNFVLVFSCTLLALTVQSVQAEPLSARAPAATSVELSWTAPGDDSVSGTAAQYDIRYSTATITQANWSSATQATGEPAPKPAGSAETFTVTGLNPSTTYYFAIKTADEAGNWSALSNVASVTTLDNVPPASIKNLAASSQ